MKRIGWTSLGVGPVIGLLALAGCDGGGGCPAAGCPAGTHCAGGRCVPDATDGGLDGGDGADGAADAGDGGDAEPGRPLQPAVVLGAGGFFGISGLGLAPVHGGGVFAVGAHYADISAPDEPALQAGRVYLFGPLAGGRPPAGVDEALLVLEPPDAAEMGGFGYSLCPPCDLNGDGALDLPVGNHLYSPAAAPNSGRAVVFWGEGDAGLAVARSTSHHLGEELRRQSDVMGQTVICADVDGDGYDDLLLGGQNAGADDTGLLAIFPGGPDGPAATPQRLLTPALAESRQYFGASAVWADLDGDGAEDLAVGGWGLIRGQAAGGVHTGGVLVFCGGSDWSQGFDFGLWPVTDQEVGAGGTLALVGAGANRYLAMGVSDLSGGAVLLFRLGPEIRDGAIYQALAAPDGYEDTGFGQAIAWVPDFHGAGRGAMLVGMKHADAAPDNSGTGAVAVYTPAADGRGFQRPPELLLAPDPQPMDAFGGSIVPLGDVDGDGLGDFFVGMESHIEGDLQNGEQTGGLVLYR